MVDQPFHELPAATARFPKSRPREFALERVHRTSLIFRWTYRPRHNTVRSGPFGPVTSGPARVAAHRGSGTSSPYPQAKESSESDTASRATTEELMEVDEAVEEDVATMGKSAEPHSELASAPALQPYVQSIAEGRKTRRRSNDGTLSPPSIASSD